MTNSVGHPYHGAAYHGAARAHDFGFYESFFFNALGSAVWEVFGESIEPSLNGLIVTTTSGEMLCKLYRETKGAWGFFADPMDALNDAVLQKKPPRTENTQYLPAFAAPGWRQTFGFGEFPHSVGGNMGLALVYGAPFSQHSKVPYAHFELKALPGISFFPAVLPDFTILSGGYLVSFNPVRTAKDRLSTGLSLHCLHGRRYGIFGERARLAGKMGAGI